MEYFILGMITVQMIFPLMDGLTAVILSGLEALKGFFGIKVAEYNSRIRKMTFEEESPIKKPIGFMDYQEEENDDE